MGVPAYCNLLCLKEKRPPEREGPRERCGEGAEVRGRVRVHSRPRIMQETQAGDTNEEGGTETKRPAEKWDIQEERHRGGGVRETGRWLREFLSSVAPPQPESPPSLALPHCPTTRTSLSVVSTSVLSLERTSLTCTRIWKAGQTQWDRLQGLLPNPAPRAWTAQETLLG